MSIVVTILRAWRRFEGIFNVGWAEVRSPTIAASFVLGIISFSPTYELRHAQDERIIS
ncbi:hypothetical protein MCAMS1_02196 [biofilm metagenome]